MMEGLNRPLKLSILLLLRVEEKDCVGGEAVRAVFTGELPVEL